MPAPYENATTVLCACTCDTCSLALSATIMLLVVLTLNLLLLVLRDSRKRMVVVAETYPWLMPLFAIPQRSTTLADH